MEKLLTFYARQKFRNKLILSYLIIAIVPLLLMFGFSYKLSNTIIVKNTRNNAELIIDRTQEDLNNLFSEYISFLQTIADNPITQQALQMQINPQSSEYQLIIKTGEDLLNIFRYRDDIYSLAVIGENGQNIFNSNRPRKRLDFRETYWYREALQSPFSPNYIAPHIGSYLFDDNGDDFFTLSIPVEDSISTARLGIVVIEIQEQVIAELLTSRLGDVGYLFVQYNRSGFTSSNESIPDSNYLVRLANMREIEKELLNENKELVLIRDLYIKGIKLAAVISLDELTRESKQIGLILLIIIIASILLAGATARLVSGGIAKPVQQLSHTMLKVEQGDLSARMKHLPPDEFGDLGRSFNQMVERVEKLMQEVKDEELALRKSELRALQAQINPHFLYNTLDSINWLSRQKRYEDVIKLVNSLTTLFRIGISKGNDFITLKEELDHLKSYLAIQKIRYENAFTYDFNIDESLLNTFVIKLILQPIIENALYHGIKMAGGKGNITIHARRLRNTMLIEVSDNGRGMSEFRLKEVKEELAGRNRYSEQTVYGLKNVNDRICIYYGEKYSLQIHSQEYEGTIVFFKIPIKEEL